MRYRTYGKGGPEVSALGFGAMRLPPRSQRNPWGRPNFSKSTPVILRALDAGVNFFDSHHNYHRGFSEEALGRALAAWKGPRPIIQTKSPFYRDEPMRFFQKLVEEALAKLRVDCIDYLLFHSMRMEAFQQRGRAFFKLTDWAMKRGYVRHRGFSSHDTPEHVKALIDTGEFSAMLLSYNWLNPTMARTIAYGARKGMGVSVMNPIGGGNLAASVPPVLRLLPGATTAPEIGLRYVLATPGVCVAVSGMNTFEQVDENVATASRSSYLTPRQRQTMQARLKTIEKARLAVCTACGYCMPCPHGVNIPANFTLLSHLRLLGLRDFAATGFRRLRKHRDGDRSALACQQCGQCLPKCPNDIPIIDQLAETARLLA